MARNLRPLGNLNLFESNITKSEDSSTTSTQERVEAPKIESPCPRCGGASLESVRPQESGGTRYCPACQGEDGCFYFTPSIDMPVKVSASKYDQEQLFVQPVVEASGKTIESLEYSRAMITEVMRKFNGELPQSVMRADRKSRGVADLATGSYDASAKYEGVWANSSKGCSNGALSAFPQNIGKCCLLLYTEEGDTVFDPFAGHNSRMELCVKAKRNYIGCDVSKKFMEFNRERAEKLRLEYPEVFIELHEIDSRKIDMLELQELADFTITSPPYYDIEDYGDEYQQLGKCSENYFEFLRNMQKVANANFVKLKKNAFVVWFVNDFRREGTFHPYHIDTFNLLKTAGFEPWDVMITDFGGSFGQCFPAQVVERKILPKRHEYGVIMRKM